LWWRDGDGDLTDELVDCLALLEDGGFVALVTPATGRSGRVMAHDIQEACATAGLPASGAAPVGDDGAWHAQRLVGRRCPRARRSSPRWSATSRPTSPSPTSMVVK